jgi:ATP-dependent RNA helicase DeaD
VADVRARRLELTRASLRERLLQGGLDDVRPIVESLAAEFDVIDIAAAALKMAQAAADDDGEAGRQIPAAGALDPAAAERQREHSRDDVTASARHAPQRQNFRSRRSGASTRIYIGAGRQAGIRPGDLVGAITGESGVDSRALGAIEIADRFSTVEVPEDLVKKIIEALRATKLRGRKVIVRREEEKTADSTTAFFRMAPRASKRKDPDAG